MSGSAGPPAGEGDRGGAVTGPHVTGPHETGPHETGPQGTGPQGTGPRPVGLAAARRLTRRRHREAERLFLAEGPQTVREALGQADDAGPIVCSLFVTEDALSRFPELARLAAAHQVPTSTVTDRAAAGLSETNTPQGLVAVCRFVDVPLGAAVQRSARLVTVLAGVRDPGNAGTVLRSADAAGADAVVFAGESVDPYNGKAVRASAGSLLHLPVVRGTDLPAAVQAARSAGLTVLAATGDGDVDLDDLADAGELARPTAWLFGNEATGLPEAATALAEARVRIPIHGRAESLNLAAAAAVCLYASARAQRRLPGAAGGPRAMP
jgi:RNA methyltransferase, TrmH family